MICNYPSLGPEELVFSGNCRFRARNPAWSDRTIIEVLTGKCSNTIHVDLPLHLPYLVARLPPGQVPSIVDIVQKNTLFPLFAPFMTPSQRNSLAEQMCGSRPCSHLHAGAATILQLPARFRYCTACVDEDRRTFGEAVWRRLHQVSGVFVCPIHHAMLEQSITMYDARHRAALTTAEQVVQSRKPRPVRLGCTAHRSLLRLADDVRLLLASTLPEVGPARLGLTYRRALAERGLLVPSSNVIRGRLLHVSFCRAFDPDLLRLLGCPVDPDASESWLSALASGPYQFVHPIKHLLLLQFLNRDILTLLLEAAGGVLSPSADSAQKAASHLQPDYRQGDPGTDDPGVAAATLAPIDVDAEQTLHRTAVEKAIAEHPEANSWQLRNYCRRSYTWLARYDPSWLQANTPGARSGPRPARVDWGARDSVIAGIIPSAARNILTAGGRPRQVTRDSLARAVGYTQAIRQHYDRLPLTAAAIDAVTESREAYALRRVAYAGRVLAASDGPMTMTRLVELAGVQRLVQVPAVQAGVARAYLSLASDRSLVQ